MLEEWEERVGSKGIEGNRIAKDNSRMNNKMAEKCLNTRNSVEKRNWRRRNSLTKKDNPLVSGILGVRDGLRVRDTQGMRGSCGGGGNWRKGDK